MDAGAGKSAPKSAPSRAETALLSASVAPGKVLLTLRQASPSDDMGLGVRQTLPRAPDPESKAPNAPPQTGHYDSVTPERITQTGKNAGTMRFKTAKTPAAAQSAGKGAVSVNDLRRKRSPCGWSAAKGCGTRCNGKGPQVDRSVGDRIGLLATPPPSAFASQPVSARRS
jgi:hypothetical protein